MFAYTSCLVQAAKIKITLDWMDYEQMYFSQPWRQEVSDESASRVSFIISVYELREDTNSTFIVISKTLLKTMLHYSHYIVILLPIIV